MSTKLCIFNQTTNLIDITPGVSVYTGSSADAFAPVLLNAEGALDGSFFTSSTPVIAQAAVALQVGQLVSLYYSGSTIYAKLASALSTDNAPAMGFVSVGAAMNATVIITTEGIVSCPFTTGFAPANVGATVYLSTTQPGSVQLAVPTIPNLIQPLGFIYQVGGTSNSYVQFSFISYPLSRVVNQVVLTPVLYSALPVSPVAGQLAVISDASGSPAWGGTAAGSGTPASSTTLMVLFNGSTWVYQ
jgi:hypothetical protein